MRNSIKRIFSIYFLILLIFNSASCKFLESKLITLVETDSIATITSDNESDFVNAIQKLNKSGGTIYINTPVINISSTTTIKLSATIPGGLIGMKQPDGTYPSLDFRKARDAGSTARGLTIDGSNQYIKYLIVENSGDNGIWISGTKNVIDHVIARYNNDSGIQLSNDANSNIVNYSYSYRNCDVNNYGANADGFAPKLGASNTVFNYCYAWDNADDGWDSFDKKGDNSATVTYRHSACWNNGNPDVFTGKYDYNNDRELDKNMWTIQQLIESDPEFENNYKNKKFNLDKGIIAGVSASSWWVSKAKGNMNGNGFKFGSKTTEQSSSVIRTAEYCVSFDHKSKGFDNNNSKNCTGYFTNCVSFNNRINYQLPYTFSKWANMWSWGATKKDQSSMNETLKTPTNTDAAQKNFYNVRDQIIKAVYSNTFPDTINFDNAIKSLN